MKKIIVLLITICTILLTQDKNDNIELCEVLYQKATGSSQWGLKSPRTKIYNYKALEVGEYVISIRIFEGDERWLQIRDSTRIIFDDRFGNCSLDELDVINSLISKERSSIEDNAFLYISWFYDPEYSKTPSVQIVGPGIFRIVRTEYLHLPSDQHPFLRLLAHVPKVGFLLLLGLHQVNRIY